MNDVVKDLDSVDIAKVLKLLPHRYPFIMIDRVIDIRGNKSGVGIKNVTINEPQFQGHFPENPVFPGVLMIEGMAQTGGMLCLIGLGATTSRSVYFMTIDKAKFRRPVMPGDTVEYHMALLGAAAQHVVVQGRGQGARPCGGRSRSRRYARSTHERKHDRPLGADRRRGQGRARRIDRSLLHHRPRRHARRRMPADLACQHHWPHLDRSAHDDLSLRLARHSAAIGEIPRRPDQARDRRGLRHP